MKHKEYEKDISSECTKEQKVVEDEDSHRILPIPHDFRYVCEPQTEHKAKKIERCANRLSQPCVASGKHG